MNDIFFVRIRKRGGGSKYAMVNAMDRDLVACHAWREYVARNTSYAISTIKMPDGVWRTVRMHRLILMPPDGIAIDHLDGNGLNNLRSNMLACRNAENTARAMYRYDGTKTPYRGVYPNGSNWAARISINNRVHYLGTFPTPEDAAHVYDTAAREHRGEYAVLNFPA